MSRCGGCHEPSELMLCASCATALRMELGDVPALLADLDITRSRQDQLIAPWGNRPGGETPLPYRPHVSEVAWVLHHTLSSWVATLAGARAPTQSPSTAALARHLLLNVHHIALRADAGQLADEVTNAIHHARHAIDRPEDRRLYLGPCGEPLGDGTTHCRQEIYGILGGSPTAHCPGCRAVHTIAVRQRWLLDIAHDCLGTSTEIAGYLRTAGVRCTPSQIRGYVARGRLHPAAPDTHPPLYRMRDVLAAVGDRYRRRNRRAAS